MFLFATPFLPVFFYLFHLPLIHSLPHLLLSLLVHPRKNHCQSYLLRLLSYRHLKHLVFQIINKQVESVWEGLEEVGVEREALLFHQFIRRVVDVIKEVEGCTQVRFDEDLVIGLLDQLQNAI